MARQMFAFVSLVRWQTNFSTALGSGTFASRDEGDKIFTAKVPVDIEADKLSQYSLPETIRFIRTGFLQDRNLPQWI
jgi:hypothetical protein